MRRVAVVSGGMTRFGRYEGTWRDMICEAGKEVFSNEKVSPSDIEGLIVSTGLPEWFAYQSYVAPLVGEELGVTPNRLIARVELACSGGSSAIRLGYATVASGLADVVLVLGVEKMFVDNPNRPAIFEHDWDYPHGLSPPAAFALYAQRHMYEFGTTEEQMAMITVKNRKNAAMNPKAHFQKPVTIEEVLKSRPVAAPIKLMDCSPMSDGAAAVVLVCEEKAKKFTDTPIYIVGSGQVSLGSSFAVAQTLTAWPSTRMAAENAYKMAKVTAKDIDLAEVHDCFSIAEILEYEDLGFTEKGKGGKFVEEGQSEIGGRVAVNASGGLIGKGHPLGATGEAQAIEMMEQLRGEAGKRQVSGAEIGLTHNHSGPGTQSSILIYRR